MVGLPEWFALKFAQEQVFLSHSETRVVRVKVLHSPRKCFGWASSYEVLSFVFAQFPQLEEGWTSFLRLNLQVRWSDRKQWTVLVVFVCLGFSCLCQSSCSKTDRSG